MKKLHIIFALSIVGLSSVGCKKFLDINKDPNHPLTVAENLNLPAVEVAMSTNVVGGYNGTVTAYWMQQLSLNQPPPNNETYRILPTDVNNTWSFYMFPNVLKNLSEMTKQAQAAGHNEYVAIGKALTAYNFAIATDIWGDIPFSEALEIETNLKPKYDSQESIYAGLQNLLDSGIYYANQSGSAIVPGGDDYIYNGDMEKWKKFMYMLKARFYLRLTKAPGRTAALQADSALAALANGFTSNDDNAFIPYPGTPSAENPWYMNTLPGAGGVVLAASFVDSLKSRNDPRLPVIAAKANDGSYTGRPSGADASPDPTAFSSLNTFYGGYLPLDENNSAGAAANLYLATYAEQMFIKAEATFIKSGAAAATPVYQAAIAAHMQMLGVDGTTYILSRGPLTAAKGIEQIINEKYIADFLSLETYNDWRRTGFPKLTLAQNAYVNYIPRRWPYATQTILTNPQPQQDLKLSDPVWWDKQ